MLQPIIAVRDDERGFQRVHVSFQSTSSCNIATVNALNDCWHFVELCEKGRGANKRHWAIEMNHARRLYLALYCWVDVLDGFIERCRIFSKCWKYWHSPMNHCLIMTIVTAYGIYREVYEGKLEDTWKVDDVVSFEKFREILGSQMLNYAPMNQKYPGDEKLRAVTRLSRKQKRGKKRGGVSENDVKKARRSKRLCKDVTELCKHVKKSTSLKKPLKCAWCGEDSYTVCNICKGDNKKSVALHLNSKIKGVDGKKLHC